MPTTFEENNPIRTYRVRWCSYDSHFNPIRDDFHSAYYHARSSIQAFDMHSAAMGLGATFVIDIERV